jgi:hypothetical protein
MVTGTLLCLRTGVLRLMVPENEAVVHAAGLVVFERRQVGQGRGLGLVEDGFGEGREGAPAGPFKV